MSGIMGSLDRMIDLGWLNKIGKKIKQSLVGNDLNFNNINSSLHSSYYYEILFVKLVKVMS